MVIDILNAEKKYELNLGDVIVARHRVKTDKMLYYKLVEEGGYTEGIYRLLNLGSSKIMATFKTRNPLHAIDYIEIACKSEIIDIIPSNKLKLTTVGAHDTEVF